MSAEQPHKPVIFVCPVVVVVLCSYYDQSHILSDMVVILRLCSNKAVVKLQEICQFVIYGAANRNELLSNLIFKCHSYVLSFY